MGTMLLTGFFKVTIARSGASLSQLDAHNLADHPLYLRDIENAGVLQENLVFVWLIKRPFACVRGSEGSMKQWAAVETSCRR
jgi:hypothetical protein